MLKIRVKHSRKNKDKMPSKWLRILLPSVIIIFWLSLSGIGGPYFGKISELAETDLTSFLPKSAEATKANKEIEKFRSLDTIPAVIAFEKKSGTISNSDSEKVARIKATVEDSQQIEKSAAPPLISDNKRAALIVIQIKRDEQPKEILPEISKKIRDNKDISDTFTVKITGPASFAADLSKAFAGIDGILLLVALAVVFIILLIVYRSPFLPFLVLFTSLSALTVSILAVWYLANAGIVTINGQVQGILFILVIGAATDYSLLYVSRYREELHLHRRSWHATINSLKGSFEPILASGGTVIAGLLCLLLSDLASNKALGPVGAVGIGFAMMSSLTLLPALMLAFGRNVFWPRRPEHSPQLQETYESRHPAWAKIGNFVHRYPRPIWIICTLLLLIAVSGVWQLKADGVSQSKLVLGQSEAREGQEILDKHFPGGSGAPVTIIVPSTKKDTVISITDNDKGIDGMSIITTNTSTNQIPVGKNAEEIQRTIKDEIAKKIETQKAQLRNDINTQLEGAPDFIREQAIAQAESNIPSVDELTKTANPFNNAMIKEVDGKVLLNATLRDAPDSAAAKETITRLRATLKKEDQSILVGGITAAQLDTNTASKHDNRIIIPAILISITIILMALLRSIIAPLLLLLTTVLSFGTTLGISAILFNNVWNFPGADPSVVTFGFVFLVALGIDYNIFLMTRVREESLKVGTRKGVIKGLVLTGGVITSAGIVLAATFAALAVIPILFLAQLAFVVAFGVLLDTIIIRSLLVPALVHDIGKTVWWPSQLSRKNDK
jgi:RND superfamily putative drug exporter